RTLIRSEPMPRGFVQRAPLAASAARRVVAGPVLAGGPHSPPDHPQQTLLPNAERMYTRSSDGPLAPGPPPLGVPLARAIRERRVGLGTPTVREGNPTLPTPRRDFVDRQKPHRSVPA